MLIVAAALSANSFPVSQTSMELKISFLQTPHLLSIYNIEVYCGKISLSNKPEDTVLRLAAPCLPGHIIVGDNVIGAVIDAKFLSR